ncbi:hypothetical protein NL108_009120 [Boleophthalmus pectinirostris]|nr:hypothetical protein NL108_009120 [Boleophthalmus pectinirostris]
MKVRKTRHKIANVTTEVNTRPGTKYRKQYHEVQKGQNVKAALKSRKEKAVKTLDSMVMVGDTSLEFAGFEIGLQVKEEHSSEEEQESERDGVELGEDHSEEQQGAEQTAAVTRCTSSVNSLQPEQLPFFVAQQNGFEMLERELLGVRQAISSLNTRVNHIQVLLQPIGHIAASLARISTAVESLSTQ